jgi:UDP-glucuronate decarboxylase
MKKYNEPKRILVTGGAGFLGSHLVDRLLKNGHQVICVDNYFTGSKNNVASHLSNPRFELLRHDITFPLYVEVDEIYNLACPASPVHYQYDPVQTTKTSVHGAINMLGLAKRLRESYWGNVNPVGIRSCYDEGKRCAETLFFDYHRQHKVHIKVARIFNTYGPRMQPNDGRVVSNFIVQALRGKNITIFGTGKQTRSFCYVDDLIDGIIRFMGQYDGSLDVPYYPGPLNLGNPDEYSILELAKVIIDLVGSKSSIEFKPLPQDDPAQRRPDISLATQQLGWMPSTSLKDGLLKTAKYFEMSLSQNRTSVDD